MAEKKKYDEIPVKKDITEQKKQEVVTTEEKPKLQPVTHAEKKKRGLMERAVLAFMGPEGIKGVSAKVAHDVVIPAIKEGTTDALKSLIDGIFYGSDGVQRRYSGGNTRTYRGGRTNYNAVSNRSKGGSPRNYGPTDDMPEEPARSNGRFRSTDYFIDTRQEAFMALDELNRQIEDYGVVAVSDFYDLIGVKTEFTDSKYGWTDLSLGSVQSYRDGYVLQLPSPRPI